MAHGPTSRVRCARNLLSLALIGGALTAMPRAAGPGNDIRLKDVVLLQGTTTSPLIGYGLVVGLNKTGDKKQTIFPAQTLSNMLAQFGVAVPADAMKIENIAAVLVTAEMPPFGRAGVRVDVTASSIGDARSLQGGTLLATPLRNVTGQVVALAQGPLSVGGFGGGGAGANVVVNHLTVGRVPSGAVIQVATNNTLSSDALTFMLRDPDFSTASRVAKAINDELKTEAAHALDSGSVTVRIPAEYKDTVPALMARLEPLAVTVDAVARVVINERTGTVVVGGDVKVGAAAVAHGNLSVRITTKLDVSQPNAFAKKGETVVVPQEQVDVQEGASKLVALEAGTTLEAVTRALNSLGATPRDIIAIMQALKAAGALRAEIVIL
jgi:flagellar P-ring protein precursor FlgI